MMKRELTSVELLLAFVTSNLCSGITSLMITFGSGTVQAAGLKEWVFLGIDIGIRTLIVFTAYKLISIAIIKLFGQKIRPEARDQFRIFGTIES
ncbi:hypothetical protein [Terribacillus saccharophilus]|uniref:hypothetical protein n=1 Tax=Terribacillus saccharophilus TaxID=361277 RepID=UPI003982141C